MNSRGTARRDLKIGIRVPPSAALLAAAAVCVLASGCGGFGFADESGSTLGPRESYESGSTLDRPFRLPLRDEQRPEAGSSLAPRRGILFGDREAGSTLAPRRIDRPGEPDWNDHEAGSSLSPRRLRFAPDNPEAGSVLRSRRDRSEAGSRLAPESGSVLTERPRRASVGNGHLIDQDAVYAPGDGTSGSSGAATSYVFKKRPTPLALVLIALAGSALILFTLLKMGMGSPHAREQASRRLELCCDLAGQFDAFMDAARSEDWDRCQAVLDHFHETNGRRAVLLSNRTNSALFHFLQVAINCRLSGRDPEYRRNLENKFALAIESLRKASHQPELLSLENRQYLVDANRSYRRLRERA